MFSPIASPAQRRKLLRYNSKMNRDKEENDSQINPESLLNNIEEANILCKKYIQKYINFIAVI